MANLQERRQTIKSTQSTAKITKAMEMVSAAKFKKFNEQTSGSKDYMLALKEMISDATKSYSANDIPLLIPKEHEKKALVLLIGTTRGLVGSLINRIEIEFYKLISELESKNIKHDIVTIKRKTIDIPTKFGIDVKNHFENSFEDISISDLSTLKSIILNGYLDNVYDSVYIVYTQFNSSFSQEPVAEKVLPFADFSNDEEKKKVPEFRYEKSQKEIIEGLTENYLEAYLQYIILNATTSEYSARMVAMKKASDSAKDIEARLRLEYNKERQTQITMQLLESVSGRKKR